MNYLTMMYVRLSKDDNRRDAIKRAYPDVVDAAKQLRADESKFIEAEYPMGRRMTLSDLRRRWVPSRYVDRFARLMVDRGWFTDGKVALKLTDKERKRVEKMETKDVPMPGLDYIIDLASKDVRPVVGIVGYRDEGIDGDRPPMHVLTDAEGRRVVVDADLWTTIVRRHPKGNAVTNGRYVTMIDGGEVVAVLVCIEFKSPIVFFGDRIPTA